MLITMARAGMARRNSAMSMESADYGFSGVSPEVQATPVIHSFLWWCGQSHQCCLDDIARFWLCLR